MQSGRYQRAEHSLKKETMKVESAVKHVLSTFELVLSPNQRALPEDRNSLWYAILDQLYYTKLCNEPFFSSMPLYKKATSLRKKISYKLEGYIRSGAIKWDKSFDLTKDSWLKQMFR